MYLARHDTKRRNLCTVSDTETMTTGLNNDCVIRYVLLIRFTAVTEMPIDTYLEMLSEF